ncbi:retrovirus-related pol polyprotein from transposon TNT 1-94 [Tanacetum coccineum]
MAESHMVIKEKSCDPGIVSLRHDRLGHPGLTMMKRISESTHGHPLKDQKILQMDKMAPCTSCSLGKLIARPSPLKVEKESHVFLERIQGDICGPIHPPCGPFRYFMVLIDASSRWSHVSLLSTRNVAFAKILAQIIKSRAHFPDHTIKRVRLDNAGEFTSQAFNDYCMSVGIVVEHPIAHVHTQNGLAESLIKRLQLIARLLIMRTKLPYLYGFMQSCMLYLKPLTGDAFTARCAYCHFNEAIFPPLGGEKKNHEKGVSWSEPSLLYLDLCTKKNVKSMIKFTQSQRPLKRGKTVGSKDKNPRKRKATENAIIHDDIVLEETQNVAPPEEEIDDINKEVSIDYGHSKISLDQIETDFIDEKFCYNVACDIMNGNDDPEPTSVIECQSRHDWNKWKKAM